MYACDARWWRVYGYEATIKCTGELWASCEIGASDMGAQTFAWSGVQKRVRAQLHWIDVVDEPGLSLHPKRIHAGKNSGYQAIGLAFLWGAAKIVLLGFDMQKTGGKTHHHGDHEGGLPNLGTLKDWVGLMPALAQDLRREGVECINASRETALACFERMSIEDALHEPS